MLRQAIRPMVLFYGNMDELEVEKKDGSNLLVDCRIRLKVRVVMHTANI
jgi:hypothetical protein